MDSIRGGYLQGAVVFIGGTTLSAVTNSAGRFRIDNVPAGTRVIEVQHPLLDTLAISLVTKPQTFVPGDSVRVILSTPSARTVIEGTCSASDRALGSAVVVGTVLDAGSDKPAAGASVTVAWTDYQILKKSILNAPQRRVATVAADGSYRICGLPDDLVAGVVASRGADTTAVVNVNFAPLIAVASFRLPPAKKPADAVAPSPAGVVSTGTTASSSAGAASPATLTGKVVDGSGKPLPNARVAVEADAAVAITSADGSFRLHGLRPGTRALSVRRLGHRPVELAVELTAGATANQTVALTKEVRVLNTVQVRALRELGLDRVGFTERQRNSGGTFIGVKEIEIRNSPRLNDLLRPVQSLRRPGCVRYFVDGRLWSATAGSNPDEYLSGSEIGAVEVYSSLFAPAEFQSFSSGRPCKIVAVWTRWKLGPR